MPSASKSSPWLSRLIDVGRRLRSPVPPSVDPTLRHQLGAYTMCDPQAQDSLLRLADLIEQSAIPGDIVECGVCNGGTAALVAARVRDSHRRLWLYDSFEGMPRTSDQDAQAAGEWVGKCVGSEARVCEALALAGFPSDRLALRKGWFQDTFRLELPATIALLHIDADWYDSVKLSLETFYPRLAAGGVVVLDDFGYWEGCRRAYYDYCAAHGLQPLLERAGPQQAYWIKDKQHNRDQYVSA